MIFFSSDHHFGHKNIIEYDERPYHYLEEMHEDLIARWNAKVKEEDIVYYLGDFTLNKVWVKRITHRLNGRKTIILGNHDWGFRKPNDSNIIEFYQEHGWHDVLWSQNWPHHFGSNTQLSHFPYLGDHSEADRHREFRPVDNGHWLYHGHVHTAWKRKGRQINVGAPVWDLAPVSEVELMQEVLRDI